MDFRDTIRIAVDISADTWELNILKDIILLIEHEGTDHSASLEPEGLRKLEDLKATHESLTYKEKEILDIEQVQRDKLKTENKCLKLFHLYL